MFLTKQMRLLYSFLSLPFDRLRMYGSMVLNDQSVPSLPVSPGRAKPANSAHKNDKVPLRTLRPRYDVQFVVCEALAKTERR